MEGTNDCQPLNYITTQSQYQLAFQQWNTHSSSSESNSNLEKPSANFQNGPNIGHIDNDNSLPPLLHKFNGHSLTNPVLSNELSSTTSDTLLMPLMKPLTDFSASNHIYGGENKKNLSFARTDYYNNVVVENHELHINEMFLDDILGGGHSGEESYLSNNSTSIGIIQPNYHSQYGGCHQQREGKKSLEPEMGHVNNYNDTQARQDYISDFMIPTFPTLLESDVNGTKPGDYTMLSSEILHKDSYYSHITQSNDDNLNGISSLHNTNINTMLLLNQLEASSQNTGTYSNQCENRPYLEDTMRVLSNGYSNGNNELLMVKDCHSNMEDSAVLTYKQKRNQTMNSFDYNTDFDNRPNSSYNTKIYTTLPNNTSSTTLLNTCNKARRLTVKELLSTARDNGNTALSNHKNSLPKNKNITNTNMALQASEPSMQNCRVGSFNDIECNTNGTKSNRATKGKNKKLRKSITSSNTAKNGNDSFGQNLAKTSLINNFDHKKPSSYSCSINSVTSVETEDTQLSNDIFSTQVSSAITDTSNPSEDQDTLHLQSRETAFWSAYDFTGNKIRNTLANNTTDSKQHKMANKREEVKVKQKLSKALSKSIESKPTSKDGTNLQTSQNNSNGVEKPFETSNVNKYCENGVVHWNVNQQVDGYQDPAQIDIHPSNLLTNYDYDYGTPKDFVGNEDSACFEIAFESLRIGDASYDKTAFLTNQTLLGNFINLPHRNSNYGCHSAYNDLIIYNHQQQQDQLDTDIHYINEQTMKCIEFVIRYSPTLSLLEAEMPLILKSADEYNMLNQFTRNTNMNLSLQNSMNTARPFIYSAIIEFNLKTMTQLLKLSDTSILLTCNSIPNILIRPKFSPQDQSYNNHFDGNKELQKFCILCTDNTYPVQTFPHQITYFLTLFNTLHQVMTQGSQMESAQIKFDSPHNLQQFMEKFGAYNQHHDINNNYSIPNLHSNQFNQGVYADGTENPQTFNYQNMHSLNPPSISYTEYENYNREDGRTEINYNLYENNVEAYYGLNNYTQTANYINDANLFETNQNVYNNNYVTTSIINNCHINDTSNEFTASKVYDYDSSKVSLIIHQENVETQADKNCNMPENFFPNQLLKDKKTKLTTQNTNNGTSSFEEFLSAKRKRLEAVAYRFTKDHCKCTSGCKTLRCVCIKLGNACRLPPTENGNLPNDKGMNKSLNVDANDAWFQSDSDQPSDDSKDRYCYCIDCHNPLNELQKEMISSQVICFGTEGTKNKLFTQSNATISNKNNSLSVNNCDKSLRHSSQNSHMNTGILNSLLDSPCSPMAPFEDSFEFGSALTNSINDEVEFPQSEMFEPIEQQHTTAKYNQNSLLHHNSAPKYSTLTEKCRAAKTDICLMHNIYQIKDLKAHLNMPVKLSCCNFVTQLKNCIPGLIACPNPSCLITFRYSWCLGVIFDEDMNPRNHCTVCKRCTNSFYQHCYKCNRCYLAGQPPQPCVNCYPSGMIS